MDRKWWAYYLKDVRAQFRGALYSTQAFAGVNRLPRTFNAYGNSGAMAIALAVSRGAARVLLLGYDCHRRGGVHWHGNHPKPLGNAGAISDWPEQFKKLAGKLNGTRVINCSPGSALQVFPQAALDDVLHT